MLMYKKLKLKAVSKSKSGQSNGVLCANKNATINRQIKKSKSDLKLVQFD